MIAVHRERMARARNVCALVLLLLQPRLPAAATKDVTVIRLCVESVILCRISHAKRCLNLSYTESV